jgi:Xaa-Pro aminopeptidase
VFNSQTYIDRRNKLARQLGSGLVLFLGNEDSSINYKDNHYPFRQDSNFLYFFGLKKPGLAALIDIENDTEILFGNNKTVNDIIWEGKQPGMDALSAQAGVERHLPFADIAAYLQAARNKHSKIHFLPPYRAEHEHKLLAWLAMQPAHLQEAISGEMIRAIVSQRSYKDQEEIAEIEKATDIAVDMQLEVMRVARAGMKEVELLGRLYDVALAAGGSLSFPPIVTVNGQILHNHSYDNTLSEGQMLLCDCGAETSMHYASDLTRTFPVNATFDPRQKEVYEIVLSAHQAAIKALKPGRLFKDVHLLACKTLVDGLKAIGLMKGDSHEAVQAGAHALFFQCGLGHMMGQDVHDMENLGEQYVGYTDELRQSTEFGLRSLRLGKALEPGFVLTVEPGIYMIPELIDQWQSNHQHIDFINYDKVNTYKDFGGIRMEDDFLITADGSRQLGKSLPVTVADIEAVRSS